MPETATREDAIRILGAMIKNIPVAMLTTTGMGRLRSRPMVTQRAAFDGELWFLTPLATGKTGEIRNRQAVHVTFVSPADDRFVWASGTATVIDDRARISKLWHDGYLPWLPEGPTGPGTVLIKIRVEEAEYWDRKEGRMVLLNTFVQPAAFHDVEPGVGI